jgi:hypothetical protein
VPLTLLLHATFLAAMLLCLSLPPASIHHVFNISNPSIYDTWFKAYHKEFLNLLESKTFTIDTLQPDKKCIPVLDLNKVKIFSEGSLDKLKAHIVVQRDLQSKENLEDKWSSMASFHALKMFLAHACHLCS